MRRFLIGYLALLAVSHFVWWVRDEAPHLAPDEEVFHAHVVKNDRRLVRTVPLVYRSHALDAESGATPVVFLHGSPGRKEDFAAVAERLPGDQPWLAPDLPGFGKSRGDLPDYSVRAHALYVLELMQELGVERAHLAGFSMGGGVAIEIAHAAPERVASVTLVSAIGVEEMELFGSQSLNHLVHGAQLLFFRFLTWGAPHFGAMDGAFLDVAYARNFYDSDQRPLRQYLKELRAPTLILHGRNDFLVPAAAAREHARLVPQAEMHLLDASHFLPWTHTGEVVAALRAFLEEVESGAARSWAEASPARLDQARQPFDPAEIPPFSGPALFFVILLIVLGTLVSEDLTCIATGLFVAQGRLDFTLGVMACLTGILVGDVLIYFAGRVIGRRALERAPFRWVLKHDQVERAEDWFDRRGPLMILGTRFVPGLRLPTYFVAGVLKTNFLWFLLFFVIAGVVWTPLIVGLSAWIGEEIIPSVELFERYALAGFLGVVALVLLLERVVVPSFTWRGRRLIKGAWMRRLQWEYWPRWMLYPPVVLHVLRLALRHRSLTLVTAVNPGMPTGGLAGEGKSAILNQLMPDPERPEEPGEVARFRLIPPGDLEKRMETLRAGGFGWPVVLKPDVGERGHGVSVVRDEKSARAYFEEHDLYPVLAQEYVAGAEFGIFWLRDPDSGEGRVFSITRKVLPTVTGDGEHTLERLILADERAVAMAPVLLAANAHHLTEVPEAGRVVTLSPLGTHCRGAQFLDANDLLTPELEAAMDRIATRFPGFHFGRFDVRCPGDDALRCGEGLRILELNGLTSEAAHVYDPRYSLREARAVLKEQWTLAFRIAAANRRAGVKPSSLGFCLRAFLASRGHRAVAG